MANTNRDAIVVTIGGTPGNPASGASFLVQEWSSALTYSDGQLVRFNGSLYQVLGGAPAGLVPPIEVASPATPSSPRYRLASRGRTLPETFDATKVYYQDQVVQFLGGTFILDAPSVPPNTTPNSSPLWTRLSETLTRAEGQLVGSSNIGSVSANVTATVIQRAAGDVPRVRNHRLRLVVTANQAAGTALLVFTFPTAINSLNSPSIDLQVEAGALASTELAVQQTVSANQVTGYTLSTNVVLGAGTYDVLVTIKEPLA